MDKINLVLIVDENPKTIKVLVEHLEKHENISLALATNGKNAIESIGLKKPDLILMDVLMQDMDGYETCAVIKKNPTTKDIPIIFFSGKSSVEDTIEGFKVGGAGYITKPYNLLEVSSCIQTQLKLAELQSKLDCFTI